MVRAAKNIKGILVMKKDQADMNALINDEKTQFLFPSPNAFAATLLIKYEMLTKFGVNLTEKGNFKYVNSHDSVYKGVARDIGQLGGGIQRTFNSFKEGADKDKLAGGLSNCALSQVILSQLTRRCLGKTVQRLFKLYWTCLQS